MVPECRRIMEGSGSEDGDADRCLPTLPISCMAIFDGCMITGHADGRLMLADRDTMLSSVTRSHTHLALPAQSDRQPAGAVRRASVTDYADADAFLEQHALGSVPVLLTDATVGWGAMKKWDWSFFEGGSGCGDVEVKVTHTGGKKTTVRLGDYVRAVRGVGYGQGQEAGEGAYLRGWEFEKDVGPAPYADCRRCCCPSQTSCQCRNLWCLDYVVRGCCWCSCLQC